MNQNPAFEIAKTTAVSFYATAAGSIEVRLELDTIWLSQEQMADLFAVQKAAISKHLKNIYASGELERGATVSKMETVQPEGERQVARQIEHFNLDAVISVGYRVNSTRATHFRQWATRLLREHLTQGYTLNRQRLETNARELEADSHGFVGWVERQRSPTIHAINVGLRASAQPTCW